MNARVRLLMSFVFTFVIVGGGALTWGVRTGQLTIFGDSSNTINADLAITSTVDLQKGVEAGDHQLTVTPTGIGLVDGATSGTAMFTLGQREIVAIYRVVPIVADPIPDTSSITMAFAGSADGVSFNDFSPAQAITHSPDSSAVAPIALGFLIPSESRFVRVKVVMNRTNVGSQPILTGFTLNYSQAAPATTGAADETVLVNGTPANEITPAPLPGKPTSLVVTGTDGWMIALVAVWFAGLWLIWSLRRRKGGHGRTSVDG